MHIDVFHCFGYPGAVVAVFTAAAVVVAARGGDAEDEGFFEGPWGRWRLRVLTMGVYNLGNHAFYPLARRGMCGQGPAFDTHSGAFIAGADNADNRRQDLLVMPGARDSRGNLSRREGGRRVFWASDGRLGRRNAGRKRVVMRRLPFFERR